MNAILLIMPALNKFLVLHSHCVERFPLIKNSQPQIHASNNGVIMYYNR
jgi:hypothetical protein